MECNAIKLFSRCQKWLEKIGSIIITNKMGNSDDYFAVKYFYIYFSLIFRSKSGFKIGVWNGGIQKNANWSLKEVVGSKHCQPKIIQILICLILSRDLNSSLQILCILQIQRPLIIWRPWPKRDWLLTRLCGLYHLLCINQVSKITVWKWQKSPI